ncbi:hypothetical protein EDB92DRAFT_2111445 [Lactarius akahatsu]|uniref:HBS1-like protein N-terminal domain-containing protein n=1 Tax=Lactarius akahatsu TaxID=416441 RepID=A0AAD4QHA3_9AGAM|nr:hypothetical protein EDB92DRAFT_2111445 [Lactarius akahatsu]
MSRHRFVRNLDLDDERDDGALSDGGDDMTPEQHAQIEAGLDNVRAVLGSEDQSGFTDSFIRETLWDCYFDIDKTLEWLSEEQERKNAARERKGEPYFLVLVPLERSVLYFLSPSPSPYLPSGPYLRQCDDGCKKVHLYLLQSPSLIGIMIIVEVDCFRCSEAGVPFPDDDLVAEGMTAGQIHAARMAQLAEARSASGFTAFPNDHLPSIQPFEDYNSTSDADVYVRRLSTITERTEKTELTAAPTRRSSRSRTVVSHRSPRVLSSATESSYGEVIESRLGQTSFPVDPNTIRPSPPPSALRLSRNESGAYDSGDDGSTRTVTPPPDGPSVPVLPVDTITDISDSQTKSARAPSSKLHSSNSAQRAVPVQVFKSPGLLNTVDKPLPELPPASIPRSSMAESQTPSDYPGKSKSKLSALASSRVASSKASTVTQSSRLSSTTLGTSSVRTYPALRPSSFSELSVVEEEDGSASSSMVRQAIQVALNKEAADRMGVSPQKYGREVQHDSSKASSSSSKSTAKPVSEAKDGSPTAFYTPTESPPNSSGERPASKLAKLAQAKSKQGSSGTSKPTPARSPSPSTLLRTTHTEYLTPIANGPTATTAITTSYQSLNHLISPARSALPPSLPPGGYVSSSASSPEPKQSKLAMKARRPQHKGNNGVEDEQTSYVTVPVHTMFKPEGNRSHKGPRKEHRDKLPRERHRSRSRTKPTSPLDESTANVKASSPKHKSSAAVAKNIPLAPLGPFAFDIPSPDDIVSNARRGTSLGRPPSGASTLTAFPASTAHSRSSFTSGSRVSASAD